MPPGRGKSPGWSKSSPVSSAAVWNCSAWLTMYYCTTRNSGVPCQKIFLQADTKTSPGYPICNPNVSAAWYTGYNKREQKTRKVKIPWSPKATACIQSGIVLGYNSGKRESTLHQKTDIKISPKPRKCNRYVPVAWYTGYSKQERRKQTGMTKTNRW